MKKKQIFPVGSLVLGLVFGLTMLVTHLLVKPPRPPDELIGVLRSDFRQLTPFQLQVHNRPPLNIAQMQNKWSMIFFGYLSCPDICPTTLYELNRFHALLKDENGEEPDDLQIIFVSVDPGRDTTDELETYTRYFNRQFIGATAGKAAIDRFTRQFGAGYLIEPETSPGNYLVAHTGAIFLVDPHGRMVANFSQPHYASTLLSQYRQITDYFSGKG